jgi:hypothetical protein
VSYSANPIPAYKSTNMSWLYDGTDLGRGIADEYIESVNDDPDFYPEDMTYLNMGYPYLAVHYVGGCPQATTPLFWNTLGAMNTETVYNHGALGNASAGSLIWGADADFDFNLFDGGFLLMGDSSATLGGALLRVDFYGFARLFVPDPRLSDGRCGFDAGTDVHMGWRRAGPCPGTPVEILGSWVQAVYSDTDLFYGPTSPLVTMGTTVVQVEVGANDPMYGDFKLIKWQVMNRDQVDKAGFKGGTYIDWDVANDYAQNVALVSNNFNGYAIWDAATPRYAFGMLDPELPTAYCGIDPLPYSPHKIMSCLNDTIYGRVPWWDAHAVELAYWWFLSTRPPLRWVMGNGIQGPAGIRDDRGGLLVNKSFDLPAGGRHDVYQALYAVPAASNDVATIDGLAVNVAKRAARWAGFARGDVNDDGCVNLADACWLTSGNQIYPDTYCGDVNTDGVVDAADRTYLLDYVSGRGPAPKGAWRFTF